MDDVKGRFFLRVLGALLLTVWLGAAASLSSQAQTGSVMSVAAASSELPDAPELQTAGRSSGGVVTGTVLDVDGSVVPGAVVTLEGAGAKVQRKTDNAGFYEFTSIAPGPFKITVAASGFATWVSKGLVLRPGEDYDVSSVELEIASAMTDVEVTFTPAQIAEEQLKVQERQRVLGVVPNFYVSYVWDAAPLSTKQKFGLATRNALDPVSFLGAAFGAGLEMWQKDYVGYGHGAPGYFSRMGASYGDGFNSSFIAGAILPSILHQDPRYFYKGTGSIRSRALYAMSTVVMCKGDNGEWQPNYSNVFGNLASAGLSNSYYPPANRGGRLVFDNWLIGMGAGAIGDLFQEFLIKKISRGVPSGAAGASVVKGAIPEHSN
jgi:Carboxypeptidase regulatory-like domain